MTRASLRYLLRYATVIGLLAKALAADSASSSVLAISRPTRKDSVDFHREIIPILQANCLPCHNRTTAKGDLRLETTEDMLKGGESGPALVIGKPAESLLLRLAAHEVKPRMPPKENKVNAIDLTSEQLGLLALWIEQGAKATGKHAEIITWQPVAPEFQAIYAVALSSDGQFAACARANRLFVYHVPTQSLVGELADPEVARTNHGVASAHLDVITSLAFNPVDHTLASGGFREVKLWRPSTNQPSATNGTFAWSTNALASADGARLVSVATNGVVQIQDKDGKVLVELRPQAATLARAEASSVVARQRLEAAKAGLEAARKELTAQQERLKKAREAEPPAAKTALERQVELDRSRLEAARLEGRIAQFDRVQFPTTNAVELKKPLTDRLAAAQKAAAELEDKFNQAERVRSNTAHETSLALVGLQNALAGQLAAEGQQRLREFDLRSAETWLEACRKSTNTPGTFARALSPDGRLAATVDGSGVVRVWDAITGNELASLAHGTAKAYRVQFASPTELAVGFGVSAEVWKFLPEWRLAERLGTGSDDSPIVDRVNALAFSPDGSRLVSGGGEPTRGSEILAWDSATGALVYGLTNLHSDTVLSLAFSRDGRFLASGGADRFVRLVETGSGRELRALEGHTGHVLAVAWKADGETLASGAADNLAKVWKRSTGERLKNVEGFGKEVTALQFLGSTDQFVAASGAGKIRLLNSKGEEAGTLPAGDRFVQALAVSEDGMLAAGGGDDGVLRVWSVKDRKLLAEFGPTVRSRTQQMSEVR